MWNTSTEQRARERALQLTIAAVCVVRQVGPLKVFGSEWDIAASICRRAKHGCMHKPRGWEKSASKRRWTDGLTLRNGVGARSRRIRHSVWARLGSGVSDDGSCEGGCSRCDAHGGWSHGGGWMESIEGLLAVPASWKKLK